MDVCWVDGLDPWSRLVLSIVLLVIVVPIAVFCVMYLGGLVVEAWREGNVPLMFLHIGFVALCLFIAFVVVAHFLLAVLCIVEKRRAIRG